MTLSIATADSLDVVHTFSVPRRDTVAGTVLPAGWRRRMLAGAGIAMLAVLAVAAWQGLGASPATRSAPRHWGYVLIVENDAPKHYGPFSDLESCDFSLSGAVADLNQRLPGLFVALPCAEVHGAD